MQHQIRHTIIAAHQKYILLYIEQNHEEKKMIFFICCAFVALKFVRYDYIGGGSGGMYVCCILGKVHT